MSERPLECNKCKKAADVIYSEMVGSEANILSMCRECPVLKQKLQGLPPVETIPKKEEGLCCSQCHTSLESVLMGEPLGCKECYHVFQDVLLDQLIEAQLVSPRLKPNPSKPTPTLHIGKTPEVAARALDTKRIRDLNESLSEALKGENYEEAAWLRDQINGLTKAQDE